MVRLFDQYNFGDMPDLTNEDARFVKAFFTPYITQGATAYVANVKTNVKLLLVDDILLPITMNDEEYENAYVSSLYTHYITYSLEELYLLRQPLLEKGLALVVRGLGRFFKKRQINKVVYVNNWLLSTNLYVNLTAQQIESIKDFLLLQYPEHAIVFRSLVHSLNNDFIEMALQQGFQQLASRQVYIAKPYKDLPKKSLSYIQYDLRQIERKGYQVAEITEATEEVIAQMAKLYESLYIDKYSASNPIFTQDFYRHTLDNQLIKYMGVFQANQLVGCIGYWQRNGIMTTPILGYDVSLGHASALYRILSALIYEECETYGYIGHRSAGAADFKRKRGAVASIEYSMLYDRHLSRKRRNAFRLLTLIVHQIGIKILQQKNL